MTSERQDILQDFYSGNAKKLRVTVTLPSGSPKDLTGSEITFALFRDDKTKAVVLRKSSTSIDEITIDDADDGLLTIHIEPKDTFNLYGSFRYHVNVVDANGDEETVTTGRISIFESFAKRPRASSKAAFLAGQISGG